MKILAAICVLAVGVSAQVGHSGIVRPDGVNTQFSHAFADDIALVGPSGIVTKSGQNVQLTSDLHFVPRAKRSAGMVSAKGNIGHSGILRADGTTDLFSHDLAHDILLIGPSGVVTKSGRNLQLTDDLRIVNPRFRRSAGMVSAKGNIGHSGILRADGTTDLFSHDLAHDILLIGPSGVVTKSGRNLQLTDDLRIVNPRTKRSVPLVGPSGMITAEGIPIQFSKPGTTILLDGPSGYVMSDGTLVQKRSKRHLVGESGIITSDGQQIQLEHGVKVVLAGPSGILLSNGKNIQL
ncbi:uncharacterized protein LOC121867620 isoform X1 [Homarus americanus]|uniref:uncharacterized protein LOC121867620 isoform X1 n=1 Tax=Homarus americanus TaxID=6706 RepID=UPI001C455265|nr:uncharacterized protein LOC121867620 isoform X1 [Homarus americanus]